MITKEERDKLYAAALAWGPGNDTTIDVMLIVELCVALDDMERERDIWRDKYNRRLLHKTGIEATLPSSGDLAAELKRRGFGSDR